MSTYTDKHREYYQKNKERIKEERKWREKEWIQTPRGRYSIQKRSAKQRGISWEFSFDSWWLWWQASGHWEDRGDERGKYCMSRHGDVGPYSPENCYCNLFENNNREVYLRNGIDKLGRIRERTINK